MQQEMKIIHEKGKRSDAFTKMKRFIGEEDDLGN